VQQRHSVDQRQGSRARHMPVPTHDEDRSCARIRCESIASNARPIQCPQASSPSDRLIRQTRQHPPPHDLQGACPLACNGTVNNPQSSTVARSHSMELATEPREPRWVCVLIPRAIVYRTIARTDGSAGSPSGSVDTGTGRVLSTCGPGLKVIGGSTCAGRRPR
jgi:hypothetical protein